MLLSEFFSKNKKSISYTQEEIIIDFTNQTIDNFNDFNKLVQIKKKNINTCIIKNGNINIFDEEVVFFNIKGVHIIDFQNCNINIYKNVGESYFQTILHNSTIKQISGSYTNIVIKLYDNSKIESHNITGKLSHLFVVNNSNINIANLKTDYLIIENSDTNILKNLTSNIKNLTIKDVEHVILNIENTVNIHSLEIKCDLLQIDKFNAVCDISNIKCNRLIVNAEEIFDKIVINNILTINKNNIKLLKKVTSKGGGATDITPLIRIFHNVN